MELENLCGINAILFVFFYEIGGVRGTLCDKCCFFFGFFMTWRKEALVFCCNRAITDSIFVIVNIEGKWGIY